MTYVIAEPCIDVLDISCVSVCPVDCIHYEEGVDRKLYIDPNECIDCRLCVPECPFEAIYDESDVPEAFRADIELNARAHGRPEGFHVPTARLSRGATEAEIAANRARWGPTG